MTLLLKKPIYLFVETLVNQCKMPIVMATLISFPIGPEMNDLWLLVNKYIYLRKYYKINNSLF